VSTDEHVTWLSEDERLSLWYTQEEYALMKRSSAFTVRLVTTLQEVESRPLLEIDDEMCTRGLEARTRTGTRQKRQNILRALDAVLCEQKRQWHMGPMCDDSMIANIYHNAAAQSSMEAWLMAQKDARAAKIFLNDVAC
jgi:hypothetical protein